MSKVKRLTFKTLQENANWEELLAMWLEADSIEELDGGWLYDHFYPIYGEYQEPCFEGWTALSYLAGRTLRLRLGLLVSANPYRHPAVLANMVSTFDVMSGGRLDLGIGAGWHEAEANAYGMPLPPLKERFDRLEESCELIHMMLTQPVSNFEGEHYQLKDAFCEPKPLQNPRPPIIIGGKGQKRTLKIAARWADDWNFPGGPPEEMAHLIKVLHGHCADINRDPSEIMISCHMRVTEDLVETVQRARTFVNAGAEHLILYFYDSSRPDLIRKAVEAVSDL
jgi:F420-dependent oxidoreductase-like protein